MPEKEFITSIAGVTVLDRFESNRVIILDCVAQPQKTLKCPTCGYSKQRVKAYCYRKVKHGV